MKTILIFGTGDFTKRVMNGYIGKEYDDYEIVGYIDNDVKKHGLNFYGKKIFIPEEIKNIKFDCILICSMYYEEIKKQLINDCGILEKKIIKGTYNFFITERVLNNCEYYENKIEKNIFDFVKKNGIQMYCYDWFDNYKETTFEIYDDASCGLKYAIYEGKKIYYPLRYSGDDINRAINFFIKEQDERSPHCYTLDNEVEIGDVVVDAGAAEGNFALTVIEKASKVYIIEFEEEWIEALSKTFEPYGDKVEIIRGMVNSYDTGMSVSLDNIIKEKVDYIKMDVEGFELPTLWGAKRLLENKNIKLAVCTYHNEHDYELIKLFLNSRGFNVISSDGVIVREDESLLKAKLPSFRKGIIKVSK